MVAVLKLMILSEFGLPAARGKGGGKSGHWYSSYEFLSCPECPVYLWECHGSSRWMHLKQLSVQFSVAG